MARWLYCLFPILFWTIKADKPRIRTQVPVLRTLRDHCLSFEAENTPTINISLSKNGLFVVNGTQRIVTNVSEEGNYTCVAYTKAGTDRLELHVPITFTTGCGRSCLGGCSKLEDRVENWYSCQGTELSGDLKKCIPTTTTRLTLKGANLTNLSVETFRYMDALNFLDLSFNAIQHLPPGVFANLSQLEYLLLHNNSLQTIPEEAFATLKKMKVITLSYNPIKEIGSRAFLCPDENLLIYMIRTELKTVKHWSFNGVDNLTAKISLEEGEIGTLKFADGDRSRNCTVYLGSGGDDVDYINISKQPLRDGLLKVFVRSGFAKRIADGYTLLPCPKGTFVNSSVSESSDLTCLECPAGGFYSDTKAFVGERCRKCSDGTFVHYSKAPGKSKHSCTACPQGTNTESFAGFRACECLKNFHRTNLFEGCKPCGKEGLICVDDSVTLQRGYWWKWKNQTHKELYRQFTDNLKVAGFVPVLRNNSKIENSSVEYPYSLPRPHRCPREQSCIGDLDSSCAKGYEGLLCGVCSIGHYKQLKTCKECPTKKWMIAQLSILTGAVATLIVIIVWMSKRKSKKAEGQSSVDIILGRLKIVIGFYQVTSGILEAFSYIQWPDSLALVGKYSAIVQLQIFQIAPLHCLFPNFKVDAFGSLFAILAVNAVAVVMAVLIYGLRKLTLMRNVLNGGERLKKTSAAKELIYRNLFFFLFVTYLNTCSSTVSVLPLTCRTICIDQNKEICERVLKADFNVRCTSPTFKRQVIVAYCALVYILVLPAAAMMALWRKRGSLGIQCNDDKTETNDAEERSEEVVKGLQFLVQNYNVHSWYWELVETTRKVVLTSGLILVGGDSRAYVGLACVMSGLYGIFFAYKTPIVDPFENKLMLSSLAVTFVNLGIGAVSRIPKEGIPSSMDSYQDNIMFNVLVFGANSLVIGLLVVQYLIYICCYMKEWRKNPQWSFSCCLALLLPLNDLQGEIRGSTGRNILKQQLHTGKIDMPSMSGALKDSGVVNFGLEDETDGTGESSDGNMSKRNDSKRVKESVLTFSNISIHDLPKTHDTRL